MSTGPKTHFLGLEYEKSGNQVPNFNFLKNMKNVNANSVHNGSDAFPNELTRFRIEAKPIWETNQKHCTHAVITYMWP